MLSPSWEAQPASIRLAIVAASSADAIREPAVALMDRLQYLPAGRQIETLAATLVIMANAIGQDPHELVSRARRQVPDLEGVDTTLLSIADYAKGELR